MDAITATRNEVGVSGLGFKVSGSKLKTWNFEPGTYARQEGAALAVGLVFLLVLTIFGISSLSTTLLEEKMSANTQEQNRAFQFAELGVTRRYASVRKNLTNLFLDETGYCDAEDSVAPDSQTTPTCTVRQLGESSHFVGGGAFKNNDLTPSGAELADPDSYLNPGGGQSQQYFIHYRIAGEAVTPSKAKVSVNLGFLTRGSTAQGQLVTPN